MLVSISRNQIVGFENLTQAVENEFDIDFACAFDKIWQHLGVSNNGNLSLAEILEFQRGLINLAYLESSQETETEVLIATNFTLVLLFPRASRTTINSYYCYNDKVLHKHEILVILHS